MATVKNAEPRMVSVFVPKVPGEDPILWVGLNGKAWSIPRGKRTEVPVDVAEIVYQRDTNTQIADEYAARKHEEMKIVHGAE
jgi:hypothetical protein